MGDYLNFLIFVFLFFGGLFIWFFNKKGVFLKVYFMLVVIMCSFIFGVFLVNNYMVIYNGMF